MSYKKGDKIKIKEIHILPNGNQGKVPIQHINLIGEVTEIKNEKFMDKPVQNLLIKGKGLQGACVPTGFCEHCNRAMYEQIQDSRWFYDFMVEGVN